MFRRTGTSLLNLLYVCAKCQNESARLSAGMLFYCAEIGATSEVVCFGLMNSTLVNPLRVSEMVTIFKIRSDTLSGT